MATCKGRPKRDARARTSSCWAAIRRSSDDGEWFWIDSETMDLTRPWAEAKAKRLDRKNPQWAKRHPVVRIAEVELREIGSIPKGAVPRAPHGTSKTRVTRAGDKATGIKRGDR